MKHAKNVGKQAKKHMQSLERGRGHRHYAVFRKLRGVDCIMARVPDCAVARLSPVPMDTFGRSLPVHRGLCPESCAGLRSAETGRGWRGLVWSNCKRSKQKLTTCVSHSTLIEKSLFVATSRRGTVIRKGE